MTNTDRGTSACTPMVTDGGLETDLIFHHGVDLPHFAAFPLVAQEAGRALLRTYYDGYADVARAAQAGLLLETPTWRANPDWGERLGYSAARLSEVNRRSIDFVATLRDEYRGGLDHVVISGTVGPRGDGYRPDAAVDADEAADYHSGQLRAFVEAGADLATAYTLTDVAEAIGIVRAARAAGVPVAISFTVETDGCLPDGRSLGTAIATVDSTAPPDYFLVNCAHPRHVAAALAEPGTWPTRIHGLRVNASLLSHAELDEATELDEGDLDLLKGTHDQLVAALPNVSIVGGCCGTDVRHVARLWSAA